MLIDVVARLNRRAAIGAAVALIFLQGGPLLRPVMATPSESRFAMPLSLLEEHADLHTGVEQAMRAGGQTGAAAQRLMVLLDAHYAKEERDAFPILRLLPAMAAGRVEPWMAELLPLADRLREEMPKLIEEHWALAIATNQLADAAWAENQPRAVDLAQRLRRHSRMEEQVFFPAALVAADCIRERVARGSM